MKKLEFGKEGGLGKLCKGLELWFFWGFGFWVCWVLGVLGFGFWVLGSGCWVLGVGFLGVGFLGVGFWVLGVRGFE